MKLSLNNPKQLLTHVMLNDKELCEKTAVSEEWTKSGDLTATVFVNGIEVNAESFEKTLLGFIGQVENYYKDKYDADAFDERVDEAAKKLLKDHADDAIDKMNGLIATLESHEDFLTPYWDRK